MKISHGLGLTARLLGALVVDWRSSNVFPTAHIHVVANDADRPLECNNKYYSPNADLLPLVCSNRVLSIARLLDKKVGDKALIPAYSLTGALARALVSKYIAQAISKLTSNSCKYSFCNEELKLWLKIIKKVNPRIILAIMPSRELCAASRTLGIDCFDIQHGIIYPDHPWYSKAREKESLEWLPSGFIVWDQYSASVTKSMNPTLTPGGIYTVGNILDRCIESSNHIRNLIAPQESMLKNQLAISGSKKKILVTMSWGMDMYDSPLMPEAYVDAIIASSHLYHWIIRLHPAQLSGHRTFELVDFKRDYLSRLPSSVCHSIYNETPLSILAKNVDLHVTELSSSVIDVSASGLKSIVTNPVAKSLNIFAPDLWKEHISFLPQPSKTSLLTQIADILKQEALHDCTELELSAEKAEFSRLLAYINKAISNAA